MALSLWPAHPDLVCDNAEQIILHRGLPCKLCPSPTFALARLTLLRAFSHIGRRIILNRICRRLGCSRFASKCAGTAVVSCSFHFQHCQDESACVCIQVLLQPSLGRCGKHGSGAACFECRSQDLLAGLALLGRHSFKSSHSPAQPCTSVSRAHHESVRAAAASARPVVRL